MKKVVVIAAAGRGNRLGENKPKCLVVLHGHYIFEYLLEAFSWADEIRMVVGYKKDEVKRIVREFSDKVSFIDNDDYANTTTLQSNYLAVKEDDEKLLFIDGDMVITKATADLLRDKYEKGNLFVGVAKDLSEQPVYVGAENEKVEWFSYDKPSDLEWANVALLDSKMLEYNKTHFFVQIEKHLPLDYLVVERLEVDTQADFKLAEATIEDKKHEYCFWEK